MEEKIITCPKMDRIDEEIESEVQKEIKRMEYEYLLIGDDGCLYRWVDINSGKIIKLSFWEKLKLLFF